MIIVKKDEAEQKVKEMLSYYIEHITGDGMYGNLERTLRTAVFGDEEIFRTKLMPVFLECNPEIKIEG
jgi:hypothetical protein